MVKSTDCFPNFGVYQGFHPETVSALKELAQVSKARANAYLEEQGLGSGLCDARSAFGFTLVSRADTKLVESRLVDNGFEIDTFVSEIDETLPPLPIESRTLSGTVTSKKACRSFGIGVSEVDKESLLERARAVRQIADQNAATALPVRSYFGHIGILNYGCRENRPDLSATQRHSLRDILGTAQKEMGLWTVRFGNFVVGTQIDQPLPGTPACLGTR